MRFGIIVSKLDIAGLLIAKKLEETGFDRQKFALHFIEREQVFADEVNDFPEDFFIFASRHRAASGKPSLTCHPIGNWGKAELGGKDRELVSTSAFLLRNYLLELQQQKTANNLPFEVTLECSHHGPFLSKPTVFIEVGSSEQQWKDENAALVVAQTILKATNLNCGSNIVPVIGLGGTHYCSEFSKLVLRKQFAFSHVCPEHALPFLNEEMLHKALAASLEKSQMIVLDWKGLGKEKQRVLDLLSKQPLPVERVQRLLK